MLPEAFLNVDYKKGLKLKQDSIRNFRLIWWIVANFDPAELRA